VIGRLQLNDELGSDHIINDPVITDKVAIIDIGLITFISSMSIDDGLCNRGLQEVTNKNRIE
jgi:hypothetical protein